MRRTAAVPFLLSLVGCPPDANLGTYNDDPVATITSHSDGDSVDEAYLFTLVGNAADGNNGAGDLVASWYAGSRELCAEAPVSSNGETRCETTLSLSEGEVTLQVRDPANALGTASVELVVHETGAPAATFSSPNADGFYYADIPVDISVAVSDAEDTPDQLALSWTDGTGAELVLSIAPDADGEIHDSLLFAEGDHTLVLDLVDSTGKTGTASVSFSVWAANQPPTCFIVSPVDGANGELGATATFVAQLADPELAADTVTAEWRSDLDGNLGLSSVDADGVTTLSSDLLSFGTHVVALTATDAAGATCTDSVVFTIGTPPEVSIEAPADGDWFNEGEKVTFIGAVYDSATAADALGLVWESDLDGVLDTTAADAAGFATFDAGGLSAGDHTISLVATDSDGLYGGATVALTINGLPTAPDLGISPVSPGTNDDLVASIVTASVDPEGDPVSYAFTWSVDGVLSAYTSASVPNSATTRGEVWEVTVTPNDGWGDGSAAWASVGIANGAPVVADVLLSPSPVAEGGVLTCSPGVATDPDGDSVAFTYAWTVDGVGIAASSSTLGDTWWNRDEVVVCWATPDDGSAAGVAVASNAVTVANSVPSLSSVSISPASAFAGDTLTCAAEGFADADGDADATTYEWQINDVVQGTTPVLASAIVGGDVVSCTATPFDGTDAGSALSASLTVANSPPVLSTVSISPASPVAGDDLTCELGTTTDADGTSAFTFTYAWTVGGASISETGATLAASEFGRGDLVRCYATPNDGIDDGATVASGAVSPGNTAPVMVSVTLTPSTAYEADTFHCAAAASDVDGDSVIYAYVWSVDSTVVSETGDSLSGVHFSRGNSVSCSVTPSDSLADGLAMASASVVVQNSVPVIESLTLTPATASVESTLTCSPVASDGDGDSVSVAFAWYVNGSVVAASGNTLTSVDFGAGDDVYCTATPADGFDVGVASVSTAVTIDNTAPVMSSVSVSPSTAYETSTLTCTAAASDADGDAVAFTYVWYVNSSAVAATSSTLTGSFFSAGNSVYCRATPTDGTDVGAALSASPVTISNTAPAVSSVSLTPTTAYEADTLTCTPSATDVDGDAISYSYAWYVDSSLVAATTSTLTGTWFSRGNAVQCRATPSDATTSGSTVSSSTVTISNTAPVMTSVGLTPALPTLASTLTCAPAASDGDGDTVVYAYAWYVNSSLISAVGSTITSPSFAAGDLVYCRATPSDSIDTGAAMNSSAVSIDNTAPVMSSVSVSPSIAYETSTLTCTAAASDVDGDAVTFTYAWYVNSSAVAATSSTLTGSSFNAGNSVYCRATPTDGTDVGTGMSASPVTISNTAPTVSSVSLTPSTAYEADTLTCTPSATDADGDSVTHTYAWYVNSSVIAPTTSTLTGTYFSSGNAVYCRATPNDGTTSGSAVNSASVTISNTTPVLASVGLTPTTAYEASTLTCSPSATDADGDTVTYSYAWYVNSSVVAPTTSTLTGTYFSSGNTVYCRATPSDGTASGSAMSSSTVTISNTAPVMASVSISPSTAYEASTLTCTPSATDGDGSTLTYTYAWYVNSAPVAPTTSTLTGTYFSKGQAVYCTANASDGAEASGAMAATPVTISNTAPTLSSVTLSPTLAYTDDTLTATPASTDADGDTVTYTYAWYVDSTLIAPTTSTLSGATYFSKGQTVYVRVTPTDGTTTGSAVNSSTLTVGNSTPSAPTAEIDPADPEDGLDPIVCSIDTAATDADGDALTYVFTWTVDGSAYTGDTDTSTTSTVPAAATDAGDVWICTIKASDGTATGSGGTATVTVLGASYTIGYASVFASPGTGSTGANYNLAQQITVSSAVQLYELGMYLRLADGDSVRMSLYTDSSGAPGTLVAYTTLTALSSYPAGSFVEMEVAGAPVSVAAGTYWITYNVSGTVYAGYTTSGASANTIKYNALSSSTAFPSSFGSVSSFSGQFINLYMVVR